MPPSSLTAPFTLLALGLATRAYADAPCSPHDVVEWDLLLPGSVETGSAETGPRPLMRLPYHFSPDYLELVDEADGSVVPLRVAERTFLPMEVDIQSGTSPARWVEPVEPLEPDHTYFLAGWRRFVVRAVAPPIAPFGVYSDRYAESDVSSSFMCPLEKRRCPAGLFLSGGLFVARLTGEGGEVSLHLVIGEALIEDDGTPLDLQSDRVCIAVAGFGTDGEMEDFRELECLDPPADGGCRGTGVKALPSWFLLLTSVLAPRWVRRTRRRPAGRSPSSPGSPATHASQSTGSSQGARLS